jgi:hypothetical protein
MANTFPRQVKLLALAACTAGSLILSACGGGGGGGGGGGTPSPTPVVELSGIAATGAPMSGATIVVIDSTGAEVQNCPSACTTNANGTFAIALKSTAVAPFVLKATPAGGGEPQVSVVATATSTNVNITPITTMIAGRLSTNGDPSALQASDINTTNLQAAVQEIVQLLQPLLAAVGTTTNPLTGTFVADGTGMDRVLDSLDVQIRRDGTTVRIEAEIRVNSETTQPPSITLIPGSVTSTLSSSNVNSSTIVASGVSAALSDLLARMGQCISTPAAQRLDDPAATNPNFTIPVCTNLFVNNSGVIDYLHNGFNAGKNKAFSSFFRDIGTVTVVYDRPVYEFTRDNGDVVFTYHWTSSNGDENYEQSVVKITNGVAQLYGNRYQYDAFIRPFIQNRIYLAPNSSPSDVFSTGYNVFIANKTDANGDPLFDRVLVTSPRGNTVTMIPSAGAEGLRVKLNNGSPAPTNLVRLQWLFKQTGTEFRSDGQTMPQLETRLVFTPTRYTNAQIEAIPNVGRWKFEFFNAGNTGSTPDAVQWHATLTRAPTVDELRNSAWPSLTTALQNNITSSIVSGSDGIVLSAGDKIELNGNSASDPGWQVGSGAWAPTNVNATLRYQNADYQDSQSFRSSTRALTLNCSAATAQDSHCGANGVYNAGNILNTISFSARSSRFMQLDVLYALYRRAPN